MTRLTPCLWYHQDAIAAAEFYAATIPDSRIQRISDQNADSPGGKAGSVKTVEFTVAGTPLYAFSAPGPDKFNLALSLMIECDSQAEVDRLWDALSEGGQTMECGWVQDRWGLNWQIIPPGMMDLMAADDREAAGRAAARMLTMTKLDGEAIRRAFEGS
ncbi:VOC family protein [Paracoccus albus]|uniref:VOC family protein n=1 Tax=Paracoccus albus TaxID=3017784 RepID=UPI0022EFF02D|nr:VOC family protein [Paracoccus albus]WBU60318.1 VOC family protein [Paracoccus albus]